MSFAPRAERLARLEVGCFDLLVIGGGITGAAVARDAAARGLSVALLEKDDWASGTSWRSSKLVHGGLRYLKTGRLRLVFESLAERALLSRLAPHLVRPADFLLARRRGGWVSALSLELGLSIYDLLALGRSLRRHRRLKREEILRLEPLLAGPDALGGALYGDARTDDARLTLENVLDAVSLGAVAISRVGAEEAVRDAGGRICGMRLRDRETSHAFTAKARVTVNAAGPWADAVLGMADPEEPARLRLSKGIHVTFPAASLPVQRPVALPAAGGRLVFAIPYGTVTLLGTTDADYAGSPDEVEAEPHEVASLLREVRGGFPGRRLEPTEIVATFAALRPLVREPGRGVEETSREEGISVSAGGLVTVTGGKLTTHRVIAAKAVDQVARHLSCQGLAVPACRTGDRPFPGAPSESLEAFLAIFAGLARELRVDPESARHLALRYGKRGGEVLRLIEKERTLGAPLIGGLPDTAAEVVFAARAEDARSVADVCMRRTHLFWQAPRQGVEALDLIGELLGREMGWTKWEAQASKEEYVRLVTRSRRALPLPA